MVRRLFKSGLFADTAMAGFSCTARIRISKSRQFCHMSLRITGDSSVVGGGLGSAAL